MTINLEAGVNITYRNAMYYRFYVNILPRILMTTNFIETSYLIEKGGRSMPVE